MRQDLQRQFEQIDKDKDGYVDKEELIEYMLKLTSSKMEGEAVR